MSLKLKTRKLGSHWWILGDDVDGPYGPYKTKGDADSDRVGILQFERFQDEPGFLTVENQNGR